MTVELNEVLVWLVRLILCSPYMELLREVTVIPVNLNDNESETSFARLAC